MSVRPVIFNDNRCFELYGYDILIDCNFKPWLLEVNASPSLLTTTKKDKLMKTKMYSELIDVVVHDKFDK